MRFNTNKKIVAAAAAAFIAFAPAMAQEEQPAEPPAISKFTTKSGSTLEIHYLLQTQAYSTESTFVKDKDSTYSTDFKVRRNRFIFMGDVMKNISYFAETDDINIGSSGNSTQGNKTYVQDAYIDFTVADELKIASGMILLPFAHHNRNSAIRLLGVDYNADVIKLNSANAWRDTGVEARGLLFNTLTDKGKGLIDYRVGVFQGVDQSVMNDSTGKKNSNHGDSPRFTGRLMLNFKDSEKAFFYNNNPLKGINELSIGGGVDYQHNGMWNEGKRADAMSWVTDLVVNQAVGENHLTMHAAYFTYENSLFVGNTMFAELGFLVRSINLQPVVKYIHVNPDTAGADSNDYVSGGLNYYFMENNANIKGEYKHGLNEADQSLFTIQAQIFI